MNFMVRTLGPCGSSYSLIPCSEFHNVSFILNLSSDNGLYLFMLIIGIIAVMFCFCLCLMACGIFPHLFCSWIWTLDRAWQGWFISGATWLKLGDTLSSWPTHMTGMWCWLLGPFSIWVWFFFNCIYLGCAGSSLLHRLFSSCREQSLLSSCSAWASHWGDFCCGARTPGLWASVGFPGSRAQAL